MSVWLSWLAMCSTVMEMYSYICRNVIGEIDHAKPKNIWRSESWFIKVTITLVAYLAIFQTRCYAVQYNYVLKLIRTLIRSQDRSISTTCGWKPSMVLCEKNSSTCGKNIMILGRISASAGITMVTLSMTLTPLFTSRQWRQTWNTCLSLAGLLANQKRELVQGMV